MPLFKTLFGKKIQKKFQFEDYMETLEEILISGDVGVQITQEILIQLKKHKHKLKNEEDILNYVKEYCLNLFKDIPYKELSNQQKPKVILFFGINGVGKTTTIAKLAHFYKNQEKTVLLSAADTFRAGAIEQLQIWADTLALPIIKDKPLADSGSVVFNSLNASLAQKIDYLLIDTAGRMHTNDDLLRELKKIETIILKKVSSDQVKHVMVIDAQTGQNAFQQILEFQKLFSIDSLIMTKLDSGAKAGTLLKITKELKIPIDFLGTGENLDNLLIFDKNQYLNELFRKNSKI